MIDKTLDEIKVLEKIIGNGADREAKLQRFIQRETDPMQKAAAQKQLDLLSAQLDSVEDQVRELRKVRNERLDRERRILLGMKPGRKPVTFLEITDFKEAA